VFGYFVIDLKIQFGQLGSKPQLVCVNVSVGVAASVVQAVFLGQIFDGTNFTFGTMITSFIDPEKTC